MVRGDGVLRSELRALGRADVVGTARLSGGAVADTWLITCADGTRMVGKTLADTVPGLFQTEADGLSVLARTGHVETPRVLAVTRRMLLLEALADRDDSERSWEAFADDLAALHRGTAGGRFGWHHDGYLGRLRQLNTSPADWTARMPVLHLREHLSVIAHFGPDATRAITHARSALAPFYPRH